MERLTLHINYLVSLGIPVGLPGVGVLRRVRSAAYEDASTGEWHPMADRFVLDTDGLESAISAAEVLRKSYMRKYGMTPEEAAMALGADLEAMAWMLETDSEVSLGRAGILQNRGGVYSLYDTTPWGIAARTYGRSPFTPGEKAATCQIPVAAEEQPSLGVDAAPPEKARFDTARYWYIPVNKMVARWAACLLVVLAFLLPVVLPSDDRAGRNAGKAALLPVENIITAVDAVAVPTATGESNTEEVSATATETPDEGEVAAGSPNCKYYLIVGTFKTVDEADAYVVANTSSDLPLGVETTRTRSRVYAGYGDSREALVAQMNEPSFRVVHPQAWIWVKESE